MTFVVIRFKPDEPKKLIVHCMALLRHDARSRDFEFGGPDDIPESYTAVGVAIRNYLRGHDDIISVVLGEFGFEVGYPRPVSLDDVRIILEVLQKGCGENIEVSLLRPGDSSRDAKRTPMSDKAFRAKLTTFMSTG